VIAVSSFDTPKEVTFWIPSPDGTGTGGKIWTAPVKTDAGIAANSDIVFTLEGKEVTANKAIYTRIEIPLPAYVVEGDSTGDLEPVKAAQLVIKATANPIMVGEFRALVQ